VGEEKTANLEKFPSFGGAGLVKIVVFKKIGCPLRSNLVNK